MSLPDPAALREAYERLGPEWARIASIAALASLYATCTGKNGASHAEILAWCVGLLSDAAPMPDSTEKH